jgi:gluconolactonase
MSSQMVFGEMMATYTDPYEIHDERFGAVRGDMKVEKLYEGCRWAEGPVYVDAGRYLLWSDIPNNRMLRWDELTGAVGVFRKPAGHTNGNTLDELGRLVSCEHSGRRISRTEHNGSVTLIADRYRGKRLNSPNDAVVRSDRSVWFTDASYGIDGDYEGVAAESEIGACNVYRVDPDSGVCELVADDFARPTGIAFSPDERVLYVADSRRKHLRAFDIADDGKVSGGEIIAVTTAGNFDSLRVDSTGRIWVTAFDGVHCFDPVGTLLGKVLTPENANNVEFGGPGRHTLFICASTSLYSIMLNGTGAPRPLDRLVTARR